MTLGEKQRKHVRLTGDLIRFAYESGYELTWGDAFRDPAQAARNAAAGIGIANSLHTKRLAVDFNLFRNGLYLPNTEDHRFLGEHWELIGGTWGGRFNDGNHYSLEHDGVK